MNFLSQNIKIRHFCRENFNIRVRRKSFGVNSGSEKVPQILLPWNDASFLFLYHCVFIVFWLVSILLLLLFATLNPLHCIVFVSLLYLLWQSWIALDQLDFCTLLSKHISNQNNVCKYKYCQHSSIQLLLLSNIVILRPFS